MAAVLWIRLWIAMGIVFISSLLAWRAPALFVVSEELWWSMRLAIVLAGMSAAINLMCGVFSATLIALQRFDLVSSMTILQTLARSSGVVLLLRSDHGIVSLALWEFAVSITINSAIIFFSSREYRELRISLTRPTKDKLRLLWEFSLYAFLINVSVQLVYYTDTLMEGSLLSS